MPSDDLRVVQWRECRKGDSLRGFLTFEMASGLVIHDCTYHRRDDGSRWVGFPSRPCSKPDGEKAWAKIVDFATKESFSRFQKAALAAVDHYFRAQSAESASVTKADVDFAASGGKR